MKYNCEFCNSVFTSKTHLNSHQTKAKYCLEIQVKIKNDESNYNCEFCNTQFKSQLTLKVHQDTAKYCLKLRGEPTSMFECDMCHKTYSRKHNLNNHKCKGEPQTIINNSINHSTVVNGNNNMVNSTINFFLDPERVKNIINNKLNDTHVINGIPGLVMFVVKNILTQDNILKYVCSDFARQIFVYNSEKGKIVKDYDAKVLLSVLRPEFKTKVNELIKMLEDKVYHIQKSQDYRKLYNDEETQLEYMKMVIDDSIKLGFRIMKMENEPDFKIELSKLTTPSSAMLETSSIEVDDSLILK